MMKQTSVSVGRLDPGALPVALINKPITKDERELLFSYEGIVENGLETSRVGLKKSAEALEFIRDKWLWREFPTFEEYCKVKWNKTARWARLQMAAAKVITLLEERNHGSEPAPAGEDVPRYNLAPVPESERVARPLTKLPKEQVAEAWDEAVAISPNGKPKSSDVEKVVEKRLAPKPDPEMDTRIAIALPIFQKARPKEREVSVGFLFDQQEQGWSFAECGKVYDAMIDRDMIWDRNLKPAFAKAALAEINECIPPVRGKAFTGSVDKDFAQAFRAGANQKVSELAKEALFHLEGLREALDARDLPLVIYDLFRQCRYFAVCAENELKRLVKQGGPFGNDKDGQKNGVKKIRTGSQKQTKVAKKVSGFVICREPTKGMLGKNAKCPRYGHGWGFDPRKATVYATKAEALPKMHKWETLVPLDKAVRRFEKDHPGK